MGELLESRYAWPEEGSEDEMTPTSDTIMKENQVHYMNGQFYAKELDTPYMSPHMK